MKLNWYFGCFVILIVIAHIFIKRLYDYWLKRKVPFIRPTFPLGNLWGIGSTRHMAMFLEEAYNDLKCKDIFGGVYFFTKPLIVPTDLDLIRNILTKDNQYFEDPNGINRRSNYVFTALGQRRNRNSKVSSLFTWEKLKTTFPDPNSVQKKLDTLLVPLIGQDVVIKDILSQIITDVLGNYIFGAKSNSQKDIKTELYHMPKKSLNTRSKETLRFWFVYLFPSLASKLRININLDELDSLYELFENAINRKPKKKSKKKDDLPLVMQLKSIQQTENNKAQLDSSAVLDISELIMDLFSSGLTISTFIMTFALYELALSQNVQNRSRREIHQVLKDYGRLTYEVCRELKYLDRILKETLRKYPVVNYWHRQLHYDYPVRDSLHMMKKDLYLLIPVYAIHRDPNIYPNPDKFDPDRFTEEQCRKRHPYAWLPFGQESSSSIGHSFAMVQAKVCLEHLIRKYKVSQCTKTPTEITYDPSEFILTSKDEIWLKLTNI